MENLLNKLLGVEVLEEKNIFKGGSKIPLGTKKPFHTYYGRPLKNKDIVYFEMPTTSSNDASSFMCIGKSGTFKTTLLKRIAYYYHHAGFKLGVLDLKGGQDWLNVSRHKWAHGGLHPKELTDTIPMVTGCPNFALMHFGAEMRLKYKRLNLRMKAFNERSMLTGLGFSAPAAEILMPLLTRVKTVEELRRFVLTHKYNQLTVNSMLLRLNNIERDGYWTNKDPFLMNKFWNLNKPWALGFFGGERHYVSPYVAKIMKMIFRRSESQAAEKYFLLIDDAQTAFGADMSPLTFESVSLGIIALTQWRFKGVNVGIAVQSPTLLHKEIYNDIKNFFIFRTGSLDSLRDYVSNPEIFEVCKNLYFNQEQKISECCWIKEDGYSYQTFFPFGAIIGH